jgi:sec-independent protein translocase protein TatB
VFDSIGWGEIVVLALAALFIFGPERLPHLARDAAAGLRKVREAITGVRAQVDESLGDELAGLRDLDLRKYHPRTFIRAQLFDDDAPPVRSGDAGTPAQAAGATAAGLVKPATRPAVVDHDRSAPPPFDNDAT